MTQEVDLVDAILMSLARDAPAARHRLARLSRMPKEVPGACRSLWHQAIFCFAFGQFYASLCTCGPFVECFLHYAVLEVRSRTTDGPLTLREDAGLTNLIHIAKANRLLNREEADRLAEFVSLIRNKFAHGNLDGIANSLCKVEKVTNAVVENGRLSMDTVEEFAAITEATLATRLDLATQEFAETVVPWVGRWAAECARRVWLRE